MSGTPSAEDLVEQWKRIAEQGMEAWQGKFGQPLQPEVSQYWVPFFNQGMALHALLTSQGASSEVLQLWKQFLDQGIEAWAKALEKVMASEEVASALGKFLDQYVGMVAPMQKEIRKASEAYLRVLGLPGRTQMAEMTSQISWVESRIEELEAKIERVLDGLAALQASVEKSGRRGGPSAFTKGATPEKGGSQRPQ